MFVFSQLLTAQERKTVLPDQYLKNPQATLAAMIKCGYLQAQELARLAVIPNEKEAKENVAQEFVIKKMAELKEAYENK